MALSRAQFRKQLEPGLNALFGLDYKRYRDEWKEAFPTIENSNRAYEEDQLISGFGGAVVKGEGSGITYDTAAEVWTARYVMETVGLAFSITDEAIKDNLYGNIAKKYTKALVRSLLHTKEIKGANIFNNGFNTAAAYAGGDGKPLFSTTHPLAGGGTFSNKLSTPADVSETAFEDADIAVTGFVDERGIPAQIEIRKLIIHRSNKHEAYRILMANGRPGGNDNDPNSLKEQGVFPEGMAILNRLTDEDAWFVITNAQDGLKHFIREGVSTTFAEAEFNTGNLRYKATERYAFGWTDPRGAFGSEGA